MNKRHDRRSPSQTATTSPALAYANHPRLYNPDSQSSSPRLNGHASRYDKGNYLKLSRIISTRSWRPSSPVCNPSRASLLTGRYPQRTGSIDTLEWRGLERLDLNEVTIADILKGAGYRTGLIGKWHLGAFDPRYKPEKRGFDEAICFRGGMHDYYDWRLESGDRVLRGEVAPYHPQRCWQWNRYDPLIEYNAAIRDGDWKLVRPFVPEAFEVPDIKWLDVSMYQPEHFIENGIITDPAPEVNLPAPPPVELYNLKNDPLEQTNLAKQSPHRVQRMERDLLAWFEDVCGDLKKTSRE